MKLAEPYQTALRRNAFASEKTALGDFFEEREEFAYEIPPKALKALRENQPTPTRIAVGRSNWPSRDPIREEGGVNIYAFVGNDGIRVITSVQKVEYRYNAQGQRIERRYYEDKNSAEPTKVTRYVLDPVAHGVVGGTRNVVMGGKFMDGFISGAAGAASGYIPGLRKFVNPAYAKESGSNVFSRTAVAAAVGGTVSTIGGGKFANGAYTATFQHLFNAEGVKYLKRKAIEGKIQKGADLFLESNDTPAEALNFIKEDGKYYVIHGHGSDSNMYTHAANNKNLVTYSAQDVAALVRADPDWNGRPIKLYACNTGCSANTTSPFAQQLATELGVGVSAPTGYLNYVYTTKSNAITSWQENNRFIVSPNVGSKVPVTGTQWSYYK